ncbi:molybdopterin synthase catalytic subunit isoform X2 [Myotis myotis]|uniref:molybdopterin synthase catalytic subunit isoform X2 n=1 Tax=Myotis myotis TaxID=51298 RepID=UPI00174DED2A|nr:molybdopterin synthase catalytic subunit isoform X2 [Myotis myotis]
MSSLEISSFCFEQETKSPSSPPLVEASAGGPLEHVREDVGEDEEKPKDIIRFTAEKLSVEEVSQLVTSPLCGAVSLFVGTTRNHFEGKKVISLEYEAYIPMAENEVRRICGDVRRKWPVRHIAVFHRLGRVGSRLCKRPAGETVVRRSECCFVTAPVLGLQRWWSCPLCVAV